MREASRVFVVLLFFYWREANAVSAVVSLETYELATCSCYHESGAQNANCQPQSLGFLGVNQDVGHVVDNRYRDFSRFVCVDNFSIGILGHKPLLLRDL